MTHTKLEIEPDDSEFSEHILAQAEANTGPEDEQSEFDEPNLELNDSDDDSDYCYTCRGTGEGMYDGASCSTCKGRGYILPSYSGEEP